MDFEIEGRLVMKNIFRVLLLLTVGAIIYLSEQPGEVSADQVRFVRNLFEFPPKLLGIPFRKVAHFMVFAVLGFFALLSMKKITLNNFFLLLMGVFFFAGLDEFHQSFVPKRTPDIRDVAIDFTGGYIGIAIAYIFRMGFSKVFKNSKNRYNDNVS